MSNMYFNRVLEYQEQHRVENVRRKILYCFRQTSGNKYGAQLPLGQNPGYATRADFALSNLVSGILFHLKMADI